MQRLSNKELEKDLEAFKKIKTIGKIKTVKNINETCHVLLKDMVVANNENYLWKLNKIVMNDDYYDKIIKEIEGLEKCIEELGREVRKYKAFWKDVRMVDRMQREIK